MKNNKKLVTAGVCLALCLVLPFFTGQIQAIGNKLLPMHLPVLLCGFLCGPVFGLTVGFLAPLLRNLLFGMPPLMPTGLAMAFELAAYGAFCGLLWQKLPSLKSKALRLYAALLGAMLGGRIVWGIAAFLINRIIKSPFTLQIFLAGAFVNAIPGILCQLILIPPVVLALEKSGISPNGTRA